MSKGNQYQTSEQSEKIRENRIEVTKNKDVSYYVQKGLNLLQGGSGKKSQKYETIYLYAVEGSIELAQSVSEVIRGKVEGLYYVIIDAYPIYQEFKCHIEVLITLTKSVEVADNLPNVYREKPIPVDQVRESRTLKSSSQERERQSQQAQSKRGKSEKREQNIKPILKDPQTKRVNFDQQNQGIEQYRRDDQNQSSKRVQSRDENEDEKDNRKNSRRERLEDGKDDRKDNRGPKKNRQNENEDYRDNQGGNSRNNQRENKHSNKDHDDDRKNNRNNDRLAEKKEAKSKNSNNDQPKAPYVPKDQNDHNEHKEPSQQQEKVQKQRRLNDIEEFLRGRKN